MLQTVRIYKPSKSPSQSGRAKTHQWVLEHAPLTARKPESVVGWVSSGDTLNQIKLFFPTKEDAIAYAQQNKWQIDVEDAQIRRVKPRTYLDNFKYTGALEKKNKKTSKKE